MEQITVELPSSDRSAPEAAILKRAQQHSRRCDIAGYREAVAMLVEARELAPDSVEVHAALAEVCAHWGWRREIVGLPCSRHYDDAYASAWRAAELGPESGDAHRAMAAALSFGRRRDAGQRLAEAQRAWDLNPYHSDNCLELWRARGRRLDDNFVEHAIALDPGSCAAHIDYGVASTEAGRHREAAYHLALALEINPENSLARYDLAMVLLRDGRPDQAREQLETALRAEPDEPLLRRGLAFVLAEPPEAAA